LQQKKLDELSAMSSMFAANTSLPLVEKATSVANASLKKHFEGGHAYGDGS
jgi:hypothetical protein